MPRSTRRGGRPHGTMRPAFRAAGPMPMCTAMCNRQSIRSRRMATHACFAALPRLLRRKHSADRRTPVIRRRHHSPVARQGSPFRRHFRRTGSRAAHTPVSALTPKPAAARHRHRLSRHRNFVATPTATIPPARLAHQRLPRRLAWRPFRRPPTARAPSLCRGLPRPNRCARRRTRAGPRRVRRAPRAKRPPSSSVSDASTCAPARRRPRHARAKRRAAHAQ